MKERALQKLEKMQIEWEGENEEDNRRKEKRNIENK
jgi:hypothetical protein